MHIVSLRKAALSLSIPIVAALIPAYAQSPASATGAIQCAPCPLSGQKANPAAFDESQVTFVAPIRPAFHEDQTVRGELIARVLQTSPFLIEVLDGRMDLVGRNMQPVPANRDEDDYACSIMQIEAVDLASKPLLASLKFNDIIVATMVLQRDETMPDAILAATQVLTDIRKAVQPIRYFHSGARAECSNRSGRLVEYRGLGNDALTIFNDGAIQYRDAQFRRFDRERLADSELSELMRGFASTNFNALPADFQPAKYGPRPGITLLAAGYHDVWLGGNEATLAPLIRRMKDVAARATSRTYFLLKTGKRQKLTITPWPYPEVSLTGFRAFRDRSLMRRQSAFDNIPPSRALEQPLPAGFLATLPLNRPMVATDDDPNRYNYFSEAGKLYRVTHNPDCRTPDWYCTSFYNVEVAEVQSIDATLRDQASRTYIVTGYSGARHEMPQSQPLDPARLSEFDLTLPNLGPYLWTTEMSQRLLTLPPDGIRIPADEYDRRKPLYAAILKSRESGIDLIEDGMVFEHLRVCQIEPGVVENCDIK